MRVWGTTVTCAVPALVAAIVSLAPQPALAQSPDLVQSAGPDDPPPPRVGYGAMPGGLHVASAETLPPGTVEVTALGGYGYRKGLIHADHVFTRALGDLAVTYAPLSTLAIGVSFDGRYDKHTGAQTTDDSYVGDPHLLLRYGSPIGGGKIMLGGQLGVWAPGKDAPSIVTSAISFDARALVSADLGFGVLAVNAGFRADNSVKSVDPGVMLSPADDVSLGVSDFSAALFGASLRVPVTPRAYVALEGSTDVFVGNNAPGPILRGAAIGGVSLSDSFTLIAFVEAAKVPEVPGSTHESMVGKRVPYEPSVTGGLGLQARFGGPKRVAAAGAVITPNPLEQDITLPINADLAGAVFDDAGKPVVGAKVTVKLRSNSGTVYTDGKGTYTITKLPIGKTVGSKIELDDTAAEIEVEVANKKPGKTTLTLDKGLNTVPPITLDSMLPPGQLRGGVVNAANGRAIGEATVAIEPGGLSATTDPSGKFSIDLAPGRYKITVTAKGMAQQQLDVVIEQNGVAIKNIELHK
jgi:hypothetical protein